MWPLLTSLWHGPVSIFRFTWASPCKEEGAETVRRSISTPTSSTCSYRAWASCWLMSRMWCSSKSPSSVIVAHSYVCTLSESASSIIVASCSVCSLKTHLETPQMTLGTPWLVLLLISLVIHFCLMTKFVVLWKISKKRSMCHSKFDMREKTIPSKVHNFNLDFISNSSFAMLTFLN